MRAQVIVGVVCCSLCAAVAWGEEWQADGVSLADPLITDRPDAAEASQTVGRHRFQIETSVAFSRDRERGVTTKQYSFPTLLRFGLTDPIELRLEGEVYSVQTQTARMTERGLPDLAVGVKTHLVENRKVVPSLGLLAHLSLPTGTGEFSSNTVEPIVKLLADWELPADFSIGANVGLDLPVRDATGDKFARFLYAATLVHPTPFLPERLRVFAEATGAVPLRGGKAEEHIVDTGLAFLATRNVQLDTFVRFGLTDPAPGFQTGVGFSWRL